MSHIMIEKARRTRSRAAPSMPEGALYDSESGVWRLNGRLVARDPAFGISTKKADIETGEDEKGE